MNRKGVIQIALAAFVVLTLVVVIGYFQGNSIIIQLLGGNEIDIALMEEKADKDSTAIDSLVSEPKNYLAPLPKYSYLGEDDELQLNNMSLEDADTGMVDALLLNQQPFKDSLSFGK